ncbi:hypothetical protein IWQ60_010929 [Tieghemiomyces parasiticus]|uniref:3-isopropylmalate dehydrogenase n=1 Tax=Tieghemiomyces parasiticus TaxID=78921 RepID=A0A9W8DM42_9FUNG|nr:hypothetical protein IWQ60_010929 [Tieghemiomyces parasiticus]
MVAQGSPKVFKIAVLAGDGIGPDVTNEALRVLEFVAHKRADARNFRLAFKHVLAGGVAVDAHGHSCPPETLAAAQEADAVFLGAIGGPQWPRPIDPNDLSKGYGPRAEAGMLALRKILNIYANIRPVNFISKSLIESSPIKEDIVRGTEYIIVRELIGGVYFGERKEGDDDGHAYDTMPYSTEEIQRITRCAAQLALQSTPPMAIHSIDKANVLATSRLWRRVVTETIEKEFPTLQLDHHLVDSAAMHMIRNPKLLNGVILTENMFGDILSDEASVIPGSLGLLPSASLSELPEEGKLCKGLYEPIHGSAPDIAGQGIANPVGAILSAAMLLRYSMGLEAEANAVEQAVRKAIDNEVYNGYNVRTRDLGGSATTVEMGDAVLRALGPLLNGLNAADRDAVSMPRSLLFDRPATRRPMTICEKILAHNAVNLPAPGHVAPGDMICARVEWTVSSEASLVGMNKTYDAMGRPGINRNDRMWLAIDHTVDPRVMDQPRVQSIVKLSADFAEETEVVDYYGPNYTIIHTEFYRERAQPGQIVIGADSHTCSAGALGALALGLGAADVVMPLVTGETWFKVPETLNIRFEGKPRFGVSGKDIILYVLGKLKRNTVAMERTVEFTGPGVRHMSCDTRFAVANMTTEFGGIAGVFEADEVTAAFISKRTNPEHKNSPLYFRADPDCEYAETYTINLDDVTPLVALYPSPDNVVPVTETLGMKLDGVFIGACTTAEEDLIMGALVLEAGLKAGKVAALGKRRVTPGSVPILAKLRRLGLLAVYEKAGYDIGAPGCSYCIAMAADRALDGEIWLSSQNRNFQNRMGPGSIANLASAATVAASSFDMTVTDPSELLGAIDCTRFQKMLELWLEKPVESVVVSEPNPAPHDEGPDASAPDTANPNVVESTALPKTIAGRIQRFGANVDTDQIIPAMHCGSFAEEELGRNCFILVRPEFRERVKEGRSIIVADEGFGSGSSREEAPRALRAAGVKAVIAKSFAFIYARNQPNMSLLGIVMKDPKFYELASEDAELSIDVPRRVVSVAGQEFPFTLSLMEERLLAGGGVTAMYDKYGSRLFRAAISDHPEKYAGCGRGKKASAAKDEKLADSCDTATQAVLSW